MDSRKNFLSKAIKLFQVPSFYLLLSSLILFMRIFEYNISDVLMDDAFISFRYAKNLANGLGLVFNPGEKVEGYTNFLWVMILGLSEYLGLGILTASKIFAGAATFGTLLTLFFLARHLFESYSFKFVYIAFPLLVFSSQGTQAQLLMDGRLCRQPGMGAEHRIRLL